MKRIDVKTIAQRIKGVSITGISTPLGGVSWTLPPSEKPIIEKFITYLEDRRALYNPYDTEVPNHVTMSVMDIRNHITNILHQLGNDSPALPSLKAIRAACRKYLDQNPPHHRSHHRFLEERAFLIGLGELRGIFGLHLAVLCTHYGLELAPELAALLPGELEDGDQISSSTDCNGMT